MRPIRFELKVPSKTTWKRWRKGRPRIISVSVSSSCGNISIASTLKSGNGAAALDSTCASGISLNVSVYGVFPYGRIELERAGMTLQGERYETCHRYIEVEILELPVVGRRQVEATRSIEIKWFSAHGREICPEVGAFQTDRVRPTVNGCTSASQRNVNTVLKVDIDLPMSSIGD